MEKGFSSASLLAISTVAVRATFAVGVKVTLKVVVAPAATVAPGALLILKSLEEPFAKLALMPVSGPVPLF